MRKTGAARSLPGSRQRRQLLLGDRVLALATSFTGPLAFVVEWPAEGIVLTRAEVESAPLLEAAARSELLWPDKGGDGSGTGYGLNAFNVDPDE